MASVRAPRSRRAQAAARHRTPIGCYPNLFLTRRLVREWYRAEQDHRHRTRGEASMRPGGGEDGRRSQRSSALHAQGECRAARGRLLLSSACEGQLAMLGPSAHRRDISART